MHRICKALNKYCIHRCAELSNSSIHDFDKCFHKSSLLTVLEQYCQFFNIAMCLPKIMYCYIKCMMIWPYVIDGKVHAHVSTSMSPANTFMCGIANLFRNYRSQPQAQKQSKNSKNWANLKIKHVKLPLKLRHGAPELTGSISTSCLGNVTSTCEIKIKNGKQEYLSKRTDIYIFSPHISFCHRIIRFYY